MNGLYVKCIFLVNIWLKDNHLHHVFQQCDTNDDVKMIGAVWGEVSMVPCRFERFENLDDG